MQLVMLIENRVVSYPEFMNIVSTEPMSMDSVHFSEIILTLNAFYIWNVN